MKNKKKKILIFLLSAACLTAGAFGIAACKGKTADPLKQAYESYVGSVGDGALSFDEWKLLIGQNVKPDVKSKYCGQPCNFIRGRKYADGCTPLRRVVRKKSARAGQ